MKKLDLPSLLRPRSARIGLAAVALLVLTTALWRALSPPSFEFAWQADAIERDDLYVYSELKRDIDQILRWEPDYITPAAVAELADWIKTPGNENFKSLTDLYRYDSEEFLQLNGQIKKLDGAGFSNIEGWSKWSTEKIISRLDALLRREYEKDRNTALLKTVQSNRYSKMLQRPGIPAFPERPTFARWLLTKTTGVQLSDRLRWSEGFSGSFDRDLNIVFQQYLEMDRKNVVGVDAAGAQIVLTKRRGSSIPSTVYRGTQSSSDFDVAWKPRTAAGKDQKPEDFFASPADGYGGERVYDTGIRLVCLGWKSLVEQNSTKWHPQWPPAPHTISCVTERTREFLISLGAPTGILVNPGTTLVVGPDVDTTSTSLHVVVSARDNAEWSEKLLVRLDGRTVDELRREVIAATSELRKKLCEDLASKKALWNGKTNFSRPEQNRVVGTLAHPVLGPLKVVGTVQPDWTVIWKAELSSEDRDRCIEKLIELQPSVAGYADRMSLSSIQFDAATGAVRCQFNAAVVKDGKPSAQPIAMELSKSSKPSVSVPPDLPVDARRKSSSGESLAAKGLSHNELARTAQLHLKQKYPELEGKYLSPRFAIDGNSVEAILELTIEDWPTLTLGPLAVNSVTEVGAAIDALLDHENVARASVYHWKEQGEIDHPRFGKVTGEIVEWSASGPRAVIRCAANLKGLGELPWHDVLQVQGGSWSGLDDSSLADDCQQHADAILQAVGDYVRTYLPLEAKVEVDPTGIDNLRWLSINPLKLALQATAAAPVFGVPVPMRVKGIIVDRDGPHIPEEIGFEVPATISTPYVAVSRPLLMFSVNRPALRVGGHITPPTAEVGPSAWVGLFSNEVSLKGYWENRRFDGNSSLTLAHQPNVATGGMVADFDRGSLIGEMRGGGRIPGFNSIPARVGGRLEADRSTESLSLDGRAEILDVDVAELSIASGKAKPLVTDPRFDGDPNTFSVTGHVGLPAGLSMELAGQAGSDLSKYTVRGTADLLTIKKTMVANEEKVRWENVSDTPKGKIYWDDWSPSIGTMRAEDDSTTSLGTAGATATEAEKDHVKQKYHRRPNNLRINPFQSFASSGGEAYQTVSNSKLELQGQELVCTRRDTGETIVRIPKYQQPSDFDKTWKFRCWRKADQSGAGQLLLMRLSDQPAVWQIEFSGPSSISQSRLFDFPGVSMPAGAGSVLERCISRYFTIAALQSDSNQVSRLPFAVGSDSSALAFDYVMREAGQELPTSALICMRDSQTLSGDLHPTLVGRDAAVLLSDDKLSSLGTQLQTLNRFSGTLPRLVYVDSTDNVWGWYLASSRGARHGKVCLIDSASPQTLTAEIDFEAEETLALVDQLRRAATLCAAANSRAELKAGACWFGRKGLLVSSQEDYFLVIQRGERGPQIDRFKKNDFVRWPDEDTRSMLPEVWSTEQQRRIATLHSIGRMALSDDYATADRTRNPISWLGLLQALASRSENDTHE